MAVFSIELRVASWVGPFLKVTRAMVRVASMVGFQLTDARADKISARIGAFIGTHGVTAVVK